MTNLKLMLWDMDGTLSNDCHRRHLYEEKRYAEYFSYAAQVSDPPYEAAQALYAEMKKSGWHMGYLTARLERNRPATVDWLTINGFDNPESAILRPETMAEIRPPIFKSQALGELIRSGRYESVVLVDNDPLVIERVTEDYGPSFAFLADWDQNPEMSSIYGVH